MDRLGADAMCGFPVRVSFPHLYAVSALRSGADIKSVQGNLGHATASFTLDVYAHFTDDMRQDSADRMEQFILNVKAL